MFEYKVIIIFLFINFFLQNILKKVVFLSLWGQI